MNFSRLQIIKSLALNIFGCLLSTSLILSLLMFIVFSYNEFSRHYIFYSVIILSLAYTFIPISYKIILDLYYMDIQAIEGHINKIVDRLYLEKEYFIEDSSGNEIQLKHSSFLAKKDDFLKVYYTKRLHFIVYYEKLIH